MPLSASRFFHAKSPSIDQSWGGDVDRGSLPCRLTCRDRAVRCGSIPRAPAATCDPSLGSPSGPSPLQPAPDANPPSRPTRNKRPVHYLSKPLPQACSMASAILHIKDAYYFEVPRALWKSNRTVARRVSRALHPAGSRVPGLGSQAAVRRAGEDRRRSRTCRPKASLLDAVPALAARAREFRQAVRSLSRRGAEPGVVPAAACAWASSPSKQKGETTEACGRRRERREGRSR